MALGHAALSFFELRIENEDMCNSCAVPPCGKRRRAEACSAPKDGVLQARVGGAAGAGVRYHGAVALPASLLSCASQLRVPGIAQIGVYNPTSPS